MDSREGGVYYGLDSIVLGTYCYDNSGRPIDLEGTISQTGVMVLTGSDDFSGDVERFSGRFNGKGLFEGKWLNTKTQGTLPLKLRVDSKRSDIIELIRYHNENCAGLTKFLKHPTKEVDPWDTTCSAIDVVLARVKIGDQAASNKINNDIVSRVCENQRIPIKTIDSLLESVNRTGDGIDAFEDHDCRIFENTNDVLTIEVVYGYRGFGPTSAQAYLQFSNYDLKTGKLNRT